VKCDFADSLLQSYFDGELSARTAAEFERHVGRCSHCAAELVDLDWLSGRLQLTQIYEPAPASLRRTINVASHCFRTVGSESQASQRRLPGRTCRRNCRRASALAAAGPYDGNRFQR
jgi:anti-sigma factor RsiW